MVRAAEQTQTPRGGHRYEPMLAQTVRHLPRGPQWAYEFKWDGIRALALVEHGELRLIGRNGTDFTDRFPELHDLAHERATMVLDGEIVVMHQGRTDFGRIQPRIHQTHANRIARLARSNPATYMIFDLLACDGEDLTDRPLRTRRAHLESLNLNGPHWVVPPIVSGDGAATEQMLSVAQQHDLEGVIAKRWESTYREGRRSDAWLKYRIVQSQEFVVGGWRPSQAGGGAVGALAIGYHLSEDDPTLRFAGFVGSGFNERDHRLLLRLLRERQQQQNPFDEQLPKNDVHFVRPELVVHVRFAQWTDQGMLRHPSYKGLREDKPASMVVRES